MTVFYDQIEEYYFLTLYMQGNVNVPGLVFENLLQEYLNNNDVVYTVNVDMVNSGFALSESFDPFHHLILHEVLNFQELFGYPSRIRQVVTNIIHTPLVSPVECCFMQIDIIHGVDTFWEEVSDALHFPTEEDNIARVAFWHFCECYDGINLDWELYPGTQGVWKVVYGLSADRINMRHEVEPEYYFNNLSKEQIFVYDWQAIAWNKILEDSYVTTDNARRDLGFVANDYLTIQDTQNVLWKGFLELIEKLFSYDFNKQIQGYSDEIIESCLFGDALTALLPLIVSDNFDLSVDLENTLTKTQANINEQLKIQETIKPILFLLKTLNEQINLDQSIDLGVLTDFIETINETFDLQVVSPISFDFIQRIDDEINIQNNPFTQLFTYIPIEDICNLDDISLGSLIINLMFDDLYSFKDNVT